MCPHSSVRESASLPCGRPSAVLFALGWMIARAEADNGLVEWAVMKKRVPKISDRQSTHGGTPISTRGGGDAPFEVIHQPRRGHTSDPIGHSSPVFPDADRFES